MNVRKAMDAKIIILIVVFAITAIIFYNSFVDVGASHQLSDSLVEAVHPMENNRKEDYAEQAYLESLIRKLAHVVEYAALGIAVMVLARRVEKTHQRKLYAAAHFYVLLVAVLDEHIQSFSNRTSSTGDILLDFAGALIGFALVAAVDFVLGKVKQ